jgi:hypothetical protein
MVAAAALAGFVPASPAVTKTLAAGGLTFSDELGGFVLLGVSGSGTLDDPFVVVEEVTDSAPAILVIRGLSVDFGNLIGSHHLAGFALTKVATNRTENAWSRYEIELREVRENQSPYGDGLSFGQGGQIGRPFLATGFAGNQEIDEPYDSVVFNDGTIAPGESATFAVVVTDTTPASPIFMVQQPMQEVASGPGATQLVAALLRPRSRPPH